MLIRVSQRCIRGVYEEVQMLTLSINKTIKKKRIIKSDCFDGVCFCCLRTPMRGGTPRLGYPTKCTPHMPTFNGLRSWRSRRRVLFCVLKGSISSASLTSCAAPSSCRAARWWIPLGRRMKSSSIFFLHQIETRADAQEPALWHRP